MANIASTANPTVAESSTGIKITNINVPTAGVEISHAFVSSLKGFILKSRSIAQLKIAYVLGESTTNFLTIEKGSFLKEDGLNFTGVSIYITSSATTVLEIRELF